MIIENESTEMIPSYYVASSQVLVIFVGLVLQTRISSTINCHEGEPGTPVAGGAYNSTHQRVLFSFTVLQGHQHLMAFQLRDPDRGKNQVVSESACVVRHNKT